MLEKLDYPHLAFILMSKGVPVTIQGDRYIIIDKLYQVSKDNELSEVPMDMIEFSFFMKNSAREKERELINLLFKTYQSRLSSEFSSFEMISRIERSYQEALSGTVFVGFVGEISSLRRITLKEEAEIEIKENSIRFYPVFKDGVVERIDSTWDIKEDGESRYFVWGQTVFFDGKEKEPDCRVLPSFDDSALTL